MPALRSLPVWIVLLGVCQLGLSGQATGQPPQAPCAISGVVSSGGTELPGVALTLTVDSRRVSSSTDASGAYRMRASAGAKVLLRAELMGFTPIERFIDIGAQPPCDATVDIQMSLAPRPVAARTVPAGQATGRAGGRGRGQPNRFESLTLEPDAAAQATEPPDDPDATEAARQLLPPGFSTSAPTESVAVTGNQGQIDRGMLNDRMDAILRGEFADLEQGMRGRGAGPGGPPAAIAEQLGRFGPGDGGIGGRLGGAGRLQGSLTYTIGGSPLNASPFALRGDEIEEQDYLNQRFGATLGGPVKIPGLYDGTRRTNFSFSYNGNRSDEIFDTYSTVPTEAIRSGDFSSLLDSGIVVRDPATGQPFPNNQIPPSRIDPSAAALLRFIPLPTLEGDSRNFRYTTPTANQTDNFMLRVTHNFSPPPAPTRGRAAGQGPRQGGPPAAGQAGRGGRGAQRTNVVLNASVSYRRNASDRFTAFPTVSGATRGSTLSVPLALNIRAGRTAHNIRATFGRTTSRANNMFAFVEDVAGQAGISGIATDPFDWGVPSLSFSTFTALRDIAPSRRNDRRLDLGYTWTLPRGRHTFRAGADYHQEWSRAQTDSNPRGTFVFTGLYTGGPGVRRGSTLDFADFLLGLPQQASVQFGPGMVELRGRSFNLFAQDDWRVTNSMTINAGVRYEFIAPFEESNGRMVNLDAAGDFSAAVPVQPGQRGPFSGTFPFALVRSDGNNIAPRVGIAWRPGRGSVLRAGYGINYNAGSYAAIARQLAAQPPFAVTNTSIGTRAAPLSLSDPFARMSSATTTNNYGIDPDYELGIAQVWNADYGRDLPGALNAGISYNGTRGSHLDMLRAPNRDATGLRIEGVQPFLWQTSQGRSELHAVGVRLRKRMTKGIGGGASYTWTHARDNASSFGGAGGTVAQDDRNLDAEWGRSSFEREHRVAADVMFELPFGRNRRWLSEGGWLSAIAGNWTLSANFSYDSGQPYTARVLNAASEIARGTNGSLRADYVGGEIRLDDPTIHQFFNVAAFRIPATGQFGTAARNTIIGPPAHQLNASLARDITFGRTRALTVRVDASNVLNTPVWGAIDTVVNSPTFGQVLSVRSMRTVGVNVRFRF